MKCGAQAVPDFLKYEDREKDKLETLRYVADIHIKMAVFWVVAPCRLLQVYQLFRGLYCLHHQGDRPEVQTSETLVNISYTSPHGATTEMTDILIVTTVRTSSYI
jgi:hypothetical protein